MDEPRNNGPTTGDTKFKPGNPGRRPGARHKVTRAIEELLEGEHEKLTRKAIEKALEGDMVALRLCLDRIAPPRKDAPVQVALPPVRTIEDAVAASVAVLEAVGGGDITPDEGARLMALLTAHRSIVETGELERRVAELEAQEGVGK